MTTEEKIALYGDDSLLRIQEDAGIQIEQLASNQVPQMTTDWIQYSAELMGNTFLGLSPEETEQQVNEYYDYLLREEGITRETMERECPDFNGIRDGNHFTHPVFMGIYRNWIKKWNKDYSMCTIFII